MCISFCPFADISHSEGRKIWNKDQHAKDASLVKGQIEKPRFSGSSQPTHHVKPSPKIQTLQSTSSNGPTPSIVSFTSRHVISITSFVKGSTKDVPFKETLIEPFPDVQATKYSPTTSPSTNSGGSDLKYARVIHIQHDQPKVPRRAHTRRNAEQNGTRKASPFPAFQLSSMAFKDVGSGTMFSVPDIRGVPEVSSTLSSVHSMSTCILYPPSPAPFPYLYGMITVPPTLMLHCCYWFGKYRIIGYADKF